MPASPTIPHFNKLLQLLEQEQAEDRRQYREQVQLRTLPVRVKKGISWYPVHVTHLSIGLGDRLIVELERPAGQGKANHSFQSGMVVSLFGRENDKDTGRNTGTLTQVTKTTMKIALGTNRIPDWLHESTLGVDPDFDDRTYQEMKRAVNEVKDAKTDSPLAHLREILIGNEPPTFTRANPPYTHPDLNPSQAAAVQQALEAKDVAVIHGPPGTGKTTTLVRFIEELSRREKQILVCAPSNTAVDLLTLRCLEQGLDVLRLGNPARVEETLLAHTLDGSVSRHQDYTALRKLRKDIEDTRKRALKFKRNFGAKEHRKRQQLLKESRELKHLARKLEDYIVHQVLEHAQVITCTLTGSSSKILGSRRFHTVCIDEAGQALEPACWIPLLRADRVIMAGDHFQLPPTVKSLPAAQAGLSTTILDHVVENKEVDVMLTTQYRMHHHIMAFSGRQFYEGKLQAHESVKYHRVSTAFEPVLFIDTAGCGFDEKRHPETLSTSNPDEADLLMRHLAIQLNKLEKEAPDVFEEGLQIGIISPYTWQVRILRDRLRESPMLSSYKDHITVNTIDGFQGQERDIIYLSLCRSNSKGEIGFLKDTRRMNVALTRARKQLVVVGDSATLGEHSFYADFIKYSEDLDAYRSAWEWMEVGG